jgi:hypothetical protein
MTLEEALELPDVERMARIFASQEIKADARRLWLQTISEALGA